MRSTLPFKLHGYAESSAKLLTLAEATVVATPKTLRALSDFFKHCAEVIETSPDSFGHEHFLDFIHCAEDLPDIIVAATDQ